MEKVDAFLDQVIPLLRDEVVALENGDPDRARLCGRTRTLSLSLALRHLPAAG